MTSKLIAVPSRQLLRSARLNTSQRIAVAPRWIPRRSFSVPARLYAKKYTKEHEWIELSSDNKTATLGITKYAAQALGDVVYVELPELELSVKAGDSIGAVESVKSASDIMTPISGKVIERNEQLEDNAKLLNDDPEGEAWFAKIELDGSVRTEMADLMDEADYQSFTEESA